MHFAAEIVRSYGSYIRENKTYSDTSNKPDNEVLLKTVFQAMNLLDPLCKKIIEKNILENSRLKTLKEELAISGPYNSMVQKKKRCIQKLRKLLSTNLSSNLATLQMDNYDA